MCHPTSQEQLCAGQFTLKHQQSESNYIIQLYYVATNRDIRLLYLIGITGFYIPQLFTEALFKMEAVCMIHIAFSLFNNSISNESANYWSGDKMILVPEYIYPTNQLIAPYFVGVLCAPTCFSCHRLHNGDSVSQFTCFFYNTQFTCWAFTHAQLHIHMHSGRELRAREKHIHKVGWYLL
jgi:hypothetical protein